MNEVKCKKRIERNFGKIEKVTYYERLFYNKDNYKEDNRIDMEKTNVTSGNERDTDGHISKKEYEEAIKKLKLGKAAGHDNVAIEMIKFMEKPGRERIRGIMDKAYNEKNIPEKKKAPKELIEVINSQYKGIKRYMGLNRMKH